MTYPATFRVLEGSGVSVAVIGSDPEADDSTIGTEANPAIQVAQLHQDGQPVSSTNRLRISVPPGTFGGSTAADITVDDTDLTTLITGPGSAIADVQELAGVLDLWIATLAPEPWHEVGAVDEPAFTDSWANASTGGLFSPLRFRRQADTIILEGLVDGGTPDPTGATRVTTLPSGFWPPYLLPLPNMLSIDLGTGTPGSARVTLVNDGGVLVSSSDQPAVLIRAIFTNT